MNTTRGLARWAARLVLAAAAVVSVACLHAPASGAGGTRVYLASFQSGQVEVFDLDSGRAVGSIAVEDKVGVAGVGASKDGATLYLVDRGPEGRLRVFDAQRLGERTSLSFANRRMVLGGADVLFAAPDGRWVFLPTYDYKAMRPDLLVVDLATGRLLDAGVPRAPCDRPVLAGSSRGALTLICPALAQEITPRTDGFAVRQSIALPLAEVASAAMTDDATSLYVLAAAGDDPAWLLAHWDLPRNGLFLHDLHRLLGEAARTSGRAREAWIRLSSDGTRVCIVRGQRAWVLDRVGLRTVHHYEFRSPVRGVAMAPDGLSLLTLHVDEATRGAEITRIGLMTHDQRAVALRGYRAAGSVSFTAAPAP